MRQRVLVTGAGGFIGHHLINYLKARGYWVRGADIKLPQYGRSRANEFQTVDLRILENCLSVTNSITHVYALAANMGGIGYIESNKASIVRDNTLIDFNTLEAARINSVRRLLYASSACVYPAYRQCKTDAKPLTEEDAYPADAEDGYGWQKLYTERACRHYNEELGLATCVVRFHNIYGPLGTYDGGKEKSPAALCRKIALAKNGAEIEIWGDGQQTRSYCYIGDCIEGLYRLMKSDHNGPVNLGTDRLVSINELADLIAQVAGKEILRTYDLAKPQGVRGRNSDNSLLRSVLDWEPTISLECGLSRTYTWIADQLHGRSTSRAARLSSRRL